MVPYHKRETLIVYVCDKALSRISITSTKRLTDRRRKTFNAELQATYYSPSIAGARVLKRIRFGTRRLR